MILSARYLVNLWLWIDITTKRPTDENKTAFLTRFYEKEKFPSN